MADISDLPAPSRKSSTSISDLPAPPRAEPTTLEKAGATARGVTTGVLGGPGDIEYFATTTVPQIFGGTGETGTVMGRKTIFPTSEELEKGIQSAEKFVGAKPGVRPELESWRGGGEFVGGFFTPGQIARNVLEKPIKAGAELIGRARGKPLTEAAGKLEKELGTTAERTGKEIEAKTKADVERLAAEQVKRGVVQR